MCGSSLSSSRPGVTLSLEQGDLAAKPLTDPPLGIYSSQIDGDDSSLPDEAKVSHTFFSVDSHQSVIAKCQLPAVNEMCFLLPEG